MIPLKIPSTIPELIPASLPNDSTGSVSGTVKFADVGDVPELSAYDGAVWNGTSYDGAPVPVTLTVATGAFVATGLAAGSHTLGLTCEAEGFEGSHKEVVVTVVAGATADAGAVVLE